MRLVKIFLVLILLPITGFCSERYYLCGSDEDGCFLDNAQYCACIPYDEVNAQHGYCLDFGKMTCSPLKDKPDCDDDMKYPNQGECLATIFQSEPKPPCKMTTKTFCTTNHTAFCAMNGEPGSCHY